MLVFLLAAVVGLVLEIYAFVAVAGAIGVLNAIGLLIVVSLFGIWLTKRVGFAVINRMQTQVEAGKMPTNEIIDGVLVLIAGVLLVIPGFVSDAIGLVLLIPPVRMGTRNFAKRRIQRKVRFVQITRGGTPNGPDDVIDVEPLD